MRELRKKVLQAHYDLSGGDILNAPIRTDVAQKIGIADYNDAGLLSTIKYLEEKGFLKALTNMEDQITSNGIDEVESNFPILTGSLTNSKPKTTGILNIGDHNTYINVDTEGFEVGLHNIGSKTLVSGGKHIATGSPVKVTDPIEKKIIRGKDSWTFLYWVFGALFAFGTVVIAILPIEWMIIFLLILGWTLFLVEICFLNSRSQNKFIGLKVKMEGSWRKL